MGGFDATSVPLTVGGAEQGLKLTSIAIYDSDLEPRLLRLLRDLGPSVPCLGLHPAAVAVKPSEHMPRGVATMSLSRGPERKAAVRASVMGAYSARFGHWDHGRGCFSTPVWRSTGSSGLDRIKMDSGRMRLDLNHSLATFLLSRDLHRPACILRRGTVARQGADLLPALYLAGGARFALALVARACAAVVSEAAAVTAGTPFMSNQGQGLGVPVPPWESVQGALLLTSACLEACDGTHFREDWLQLHGFHCLSAALATAIDAATAASLEPATGSAALANGSVDRLRIPESLADVLVRVMEPVFRAGEVDKDRDLELAGLQGLGLNLALWSRLPPGLQVRGLTAVAAAASHRGAMVSSAVPLSRLLYFLEDALVQQDKADKGGRAARVGKGKEQRVGQELVATLRQLIFVMLCASLEPTSTSGPGTKGLPPAGTPQCWVNMFEPILDYSNTLDD